MIARSNEVDLTNLVRYLEQVLGLRIEPRQWDGCHALPQYLVDGYEYYSTRLLTHECLLMLDVSDQGRTPSAISKQTGKVMETTGHIVIYVRRTLDSWTRQRLIEHQVQFIVPGNQLFIPSLGLDLREYYRRAKPRSEVFRPATQLLMLYILYNRAYDSLVQTEAAGLVRYSLMTISRAFDEFEMHGIGEQRIQGKERIIAFPIRGKELWQQVLPFLDSPISMRKLVASPLPVGTGLPAGLSALAHYTDLAEPKIPTLALDIKQWKALRPRLEEVAVREPGIIEIERWKYPPDKLAGTQAVDRLSLYLALRGDADERVEGAVATLLEEMQW